MEATPNLGLAITAESDNPKFKDWRTALTGNSSNSNMMLIDAAINSVQVWKNEKDNTPFLWGMLKYGLNYDQNSGANPLL